MGIVVGWQHDGFREIRLKRKKGVGRQRKKNEGRALGANETFVPTIFEEFTMFALAVDEQRSEEGESRAFA